VLSDTIEETATRENQLKGSSRKQKTHIINKFDPEWRDLYDEYKYKNF
jgi:predicted GIY-YIG superfamily endonuclease